MVQITNQDDALHSCNFPSGELVPRVVDARTEIFKTTRLNRSSSVAYISLLFVLREEIALVFSFAVFFVL
ncbi:hypothetical protein GUJ93_ZPchr0006g44735 [Zizania palustris]|uniref:Uncharacterized protein n=1 Tax=Zizania palustris TaxID=103762 RepID=A0A8J5T6A9_ZIZPA|nr:hypothetical protein GUJ93_ZPchr0006g44735 [Zizania palustris]